MVDVFSGIDRFLLLVLALGFFAVIIALYVFYAYGLMKIAKKNDVRGSWMAWIPIFNFYLMGKMAFNKGIGWCMVILSLLGGTGEVTINDQVIASGSILSAPYNSWASMAFLILLLISLYRIYEKMSEKAVVMIIMTILSLGLLTPIFLFAIRNNEVKI